MKQFRVYHCFDCMALQSYCHEELGVATWLPLERIERVVDGVKAVKITCAMPGYIFVPVGKEGTFRRGLGERFQARVMLEYYGDPQMKKVDRQFFQRPVTVDWAQLQTMQATINGEGRAAPAPVFEVGDTVEGLGVFGGMTGKVTHVRKNGKIRVVFGVMPVDMPALLLQIIKI